ncbi:Dihydrofolate reductase [Vibrio chagasii]|nr:Dihydrofolate reductase [Vibrio chagasii]
MLKIIVGVEENGGIGIGNKLPWHVPADLAHFKSETSGLPVVMGRSTYDSLPIKPLPNRQNIVLTRDGSFRPLDVVVLNSINELMGSFEVAYIIGGASVYEQFIGIADEIIITRLHLSVECDTFFPEFESLYTLVESRSEFCAKSGVAMDIERWSLDVK